MGAPELQLSQRPQPALDHAFVGRDAAAVSQPAGQSQGIREPFEVRAGGRRVGGSELRPPRVVEAALQVRRQPIPLLHRQQPVADLEHEVGELASTRLREQGRAGLGMPRHEGGVPGSMVPLAAAGEGGRATLQRRSARQSPPRGLGPEQQRLAGVEVPVLAVALPGKEEGAESELVVRERVHAGRQHAELGRELVRGRALQDAQRREGRRPQLRPGGFDDGAAPSAEVAEVTSQVEAQVAPGRLADLGPAAELPEPRERQ